MKINKYNKQTQDLMQKVIAHLKQKYGTVNGEWNIILTLLGDNIQLYLACKDSIAANGIYDASTGRKNPLLSTMKDLQATIIKQVQHLGLSPYALSRLGSSDEDNTEDFVDLLTEENETTY